MALGSTQPLTDVSTKNLPGGKGRAARKANNLTAICEPIVTKVWEPRRLTPLWASTDCYGDSLFLLMGLKDHCFLRGRRKSVTQANELPCALRYCCPDLNAT
jgi:hypothetical protein